MFVPSDKMCILYVPYWMWLCLLKCMRAEKLRWGRTTNNNDQNFVTCMCYYAVLHDYIVVWRMEAISRLILVKWVNVFVCVCALGDDAYTLLPALLILLITTIQWVYQIGMKKFWGGRCTTHNFFNSSGEYMTLFECFTQFKNVRVDFTYILCTHITSIHHTRSMQCIRIRIRRGVNMVRIIFSFRGRKAK